MRKIWISLLFLLCLSPMTVSAEEGCIEIKYYSKKDWVAYENLIDTSFEEGDIGFLNSRDIWVSYNVLGTWGSPKTASSLAFLGYEKKEVEANHISDPNFFSIGFNQEVYVGSITFTINAYDDESNLLTKHIYTDSTVLWNDEAQRAERVGGNYITQIDDAGEVTIRIDDTIENIYIFFDDYDDSNIYEFDGFQMNDYKVYEHVEWTLDYIEDTEVSTTTVCSGTGEYSPNGSDEWKTLASTVFSPSISAINYTPQLISSTVFYDVARNYANTSGVDPWNVIDKGRGWLGGLSYQIKGWTSWWSSYGSGGTTFPYITSDSNENTGVIYVPTAVSYTNNSSGAWATSWDRNWCQIDYGLPSTPCYKHGGHVSGTTKNNAYDVTMKIYSNVIAPEYRVIEKVDYYLVNTITNEESYLKTSDETPQSFSIDQTGIWKIKAVITDLKGGSGEALSKKFHIDNEKPYATFDYNGYVAGYLSNHNEAITIYPQDNHSGILKWRYSLSKDNGSTWFSSSSWLTSESEIIELTSTGDWMVKVETMDEVGNEGISYSSVVLLQHASTEIIQMMSPSYEVGEETYVQARIECVDCGGEDVIEYRVYANELLIEEGEEGTSGNLDLYILYVTTASNTTFKVISNIKGSDELDEMSLDAYAISKDVAITSTNSTIFEGDVMYATSSSGNKVYKEYLEITVLYDEELYAGEGNLITTITEYKNECSELSGYTCVASNTLTYDEAYIIFDEASEAVDVLYESNDKYVVNLEYTGSALVLPNYYASIKEGTIYIDYAEDRLDAGRSWYTNKKLEDGIYPFIVNLKQLGHNQFELTFNLSYEINGKISDQYRIRFVDPNNAFPNGDSDMWEAYRSWLETFR